MSTAELAFKPYSRQQMARHADDGDPANLARLGGTEFKRDNLGFNPLRVRHNAGLAWAHEETQTARLGGAGRAHFSKGGFDFTKRAFFALDNLPQPEGAHDCGVSGADKELFQRVASHLLATFEDDNAPREVEGVLAGMGHQDERGFSCFQKRPEKIAHFTSLFVVEARERFIHQQEFRLLGEGPGEGDALAFAAGEMVERGARAMSEADAVEQVSGLFYATAPARGEGDLIKGAKVREQGQSLENQGHLAVLGRDQHFASA